MGYSNSDPAPIPKLFYIFFHVSRPEFEKFSEFPIQTRRNRGGFGTGIGADKIGAGEMTILTKELDEK